MEAYIKTWKKALKVSGRSRRKEYWMFALINVIVAFLAMVLVAVTANIPAIMEAIQAGQEPTFPALAVGIYGLYSFFSLISMVPGFTVFVRRMHDINKSGLVLFLILIPLIGAIMLLVFTLTAGTEGDNRFGSDPKAE